MKRRSAVMVLGAFALTSCGSASTTSSVSTPSTSPVIATTVVPATAASTTVAPARHLDHPTLGAALPTVEQLPWLPVGTTSSDDHDLTSSLRTVDCAGSASVIPVREESSTNRGFIAGRYSVATVTAYDVETVGDAHGFMQSIATLIGCTQPDPRGLTAELVALDAAQCDEAIAVRVQQPVGETIDAWCRVGNLIAWVRLYPVGALDAQGNPSVSAVQPTDDQAQKTIDVVADGLRQVFVTAG